MTQPSSCTQCHPRGGGSACPIGPVTPTGCEGCAVAPPQPGLTCGFPSCTTLQEGGPTRARARKPENPAAETGSRSRSRGGRRRLPAAPSGDPAGRHPPESSAAVTEPPAALRGATAPRGAGGTVAVCGPWVVRGGRGGSLRSGRRQRQAHAARGRPGQAAQARSPTASQDTPARRALGQSPPPDRRDPPLSPPRVKGGSSGRLARSDQSAGTNAVQADFTGPPAGAPARTARPPAGSRVSARPPARSRSPPAGRTSPPPQARAQAIRGLSAPHRSAVPQPGSARDCLARSRSHPRT